MGFNAPSKIQETALPTLLADPPQNMIAQSQSGTGKTAAFVSFSTFYFAFFSSIFDIRLFEFAGVSYVVAGRHEQKFPTSSLLESHL